MVFPWKSIWKAGAPPRVAFFVLTAAHGKILIMDNLCKRHICIVDWCCMCKHSEELLTIYFFIMRQLRVCGPWCSAFSGLFG